MDMDSAPLVACTVCSSTFTAHPSAFMDAPISDAPSPGYHLPNTRTPGPLFGLVEISTPSPMSAPYPRDTDQASRSRTRSHLEAR